MHRDSNLSISFHSKARALRDVAPLIKSARVLPSVVFTVNDWIEECDAVVKRITKLTPDERPLIIRSSSLSEDGDRYSNAGYYLSVPNVIGVSAAKAAIASVIDSYGTSVRPDDEILVQPMATNL
jgi:hypothetical protein